MKETRFLVGDAWYLHPKSGVITKGWEIELDFWSYDGELLGDGDWENFLGWCGKELEIMDYDLETMEWIPRSKVIDYYTRVMGYSLSRIPIPPTLERKFSQGPVSF